MQVYIPAFVPHYSYSARPRVKKVLANRCTDMITSLMLPRKLTLRHHILVLAASLALPKKSTPIKSITCSLFCKTPGWRGTFAFTRSPLLPQSHAPRGASIPSALNQLRILSVAMGVRVNKGRPLESNRVTSRLGGIR